MLASRRSGRNNWELIPMDMKIKTLSWNVRGLNDGEKRKMIKSVVRSQKIQ